MKEYKFSGGEQLGLVEMQELANEYAKDGWRLVSGHPSEYEYNKYYRSDTSDLRVLTVRNTTYIWERDIKEEKK